MTHEKNNTHIEIIVKRMLALRRIQICLEKKKENKKKMHNARPNPPGIQMHPSFRGAGKIPAPWTREDQRIQKTISPEG